MTFIRKRIAVVHDIQPDEERILREVANERCGLCWDVWPVSQMLDNDGLRRCPDCYDKMGVYRRAEVQQHDSDRIAQRQTRPQISMAPLDDSNPPHIRSMENASGTRIYQANPLVLVRSGAAVQLIIKGGDFSSTDSFTYPTGISDSVAPSLSGSTQWTLTLTASGAATPGDNTLTFNGHQYRGYLRVG
jgi:hypothetical protein